MARIKIEDLPVNEDMSASELKGIFGGFNPQPEPPLKLFGFHQVRRGIGQRGHRRGGVRVSLGDVNRVAQTAGINVKGLNDRPSF